MISSPDSPQSHIPERHQASGLRFLTEQDGPSERLLKAKLVEFFNRDKSVQQAYLARVEMNKLESVAVCLKTRFGEDLGMAEKIGRVFATVFGPDQFMDILFLTDEREAELRAACPPFFTKE